MIAVCEYTKRNWAFIKPAHPLHNYLSILSSQEAGKMASTVHWKPVQLFKHRFIELAGGVKVGECFHSNTPYVASGPSQELVEHQMPEAV